MLSCYVCSRDGYLRLVRTTGNVTVYNSWELSAIRPDRLGHCNIDVVLSVGQQMSVYWRPWATQAGNHLKLAMVTDFLPLYSRLGAVSPVEAWGQVVGNGVEGDPRWCSARPNHPEPARL